MAQKLPRLDVAVGDSQGPHVANAIIHRGKLQKPEVISFTIAAASLVFMNEARSGPTALHRQGQHPAARALTPARRPSGTAVQGMEY